MTTTYDLYLFRPEEGVDPGQTLQELLSADGRLVLRKVLASKSPASVRQAEVESLRAASRSPEADDAARKENLRLAEALRARRPSLSIVPAVPNLKGDETTRVQLRHSTQDVELRIARDYVHVTVPLSLSTAQVRQAMEEVAAVIRFLEAERGVRTFDPQLNRVIQLPAELDSVLELYAHSADTAMRPTVPRAPPKPWWRFW